MKILKISLSLLACLTFAGMSAQTDSEIEKKVIKRFGQIDTDSDKLISLEEMIASDKKYNKDNADQAKRKFSTMDKNKDKSVSFDEFSARLTTYLKKKATQN